MMKSMNWKATGVMGLMVAAVAGCHRSSATTIPPAEMARSCLEAGLRAWQGGQEAPGAISVASTETQMVDSLWKEGSRLSAFEVLAEEPGSGGARAFPVRLTLEGEAAPRTVRYFVVGQGPVWVFAEADFQQTPEGM